MKSLLKKGLLPFAFAIFPMLAQAQIKVEAEDYTDAQSLKTKIILENQNTTVGYFDELGETMTYKVDIPESGLYQFSFKYLSGKSGAIKIEDKDGASFIYDIKANLTSGNWWELDINNWFEYLTEDGALFRFEEGEQTFIVTNMGVALNIDFFTLTKSSSTDDVVTKITTVPRKLEIMPEETKSIIAKGLNANGEIVAKKIEWSSNASNGEYKAGTSFGSDVINVKIGGVEKEVKVSICKPEKKQEFVVSKHGQLNVKGGSVCDKDGNTVSLMGPSFYWSCSAALWWKKETVDYLVSQHNVQIIRLPVSIAPSEGNSWEGAATWNEDNYYHSPDNTKKMVDEVVKAAIENDIYVIIDFHEHHAEHWVDLSKEFFTYFAKKWGSYPNVMYEIYNEPMNETSNETVVSYAKEIIPVIRNYDSKNIIIVGSTRYSREPHNVTAAGAGQTNIAYTWHGYVMWGHQDDWNSHPEWAQSVPIVVTEWGVQGTKGDGGLISIYKSKSLINCFWSMNNKGGEDSDWSILKPNCFKTTGWTEAEMTTNGAYMLDVTKNWINYKPVVLSTSKELNLSVASGKTLILPVPEITLSGEATGGTEQYQYTWKQVSGPAGAVIASANSSTTTVSGLVAGTYRFRLYVTDGEDELDADVSFTIHPEGYVNPGLIDDFEDGDKVSSWRGEWGTFNDQNKNANPHSDVSISAEQGVMNIQYNLGNKWQGEGWMGDPYCGFELFLNEDKVGEDLTDCNLITYRYRGASHDFRAETGAVEDEDYHSIHMSESDEWTTASISWSSLRQASDWGEDKDLDKADIVKFSWQFKGDANSSGKLEIDDLVCEGITTITPESKADSDKFAIYHIANGKYSIITEEACDIAICDIAGRVIKKFKAIPMFDNELNLSERGVYIVKVGTSAEKLIVK